MRLTDIDNVIADSEVLLLQTGALATRAEAYLTGYLLVFISARFQREVARIVDSELRLGKGDPKLKNFVERSLRLHFQSVNLDQLKNLLDHFGGSCKDTFIRKLDLSPTNRRASSSYTNLILNRHSTAHTQGSQMTFQEAKNAYLEAHVVLDFFAEALK